jgi:hypothetical protein
MPPSGWSVASHRGHSMRPVSSKITFFYKRLLPIVRLFGILLFLLIAYLDLSGIDPSIKIIMIVAMLIMLFIFWFKVSGDLADEVLDAGNALVVRRGGQEERIELSDIKKIKYDPWMQLPVVTMSLRRDTAFGNRVTFFAPLSFRGSPVIHDLVERIEAARGTR